jgi:hypothetical protein
MCGVLQFVYILFVGGQLLLKTLQCLWLPSFGSNLQDMSWTAAVAVHAGDCGTLSAAAAGNVYADLCRRLSTPGDMSCS